MAREKLCVGVDIGASSVKLCQIKKTSRGLVLEKFGTLALPSETVVDGALMNSARVVEALQELMQSQKVKHKQVALAISGHSVIIKKIPLPQMTRQELEASIQWEAEQFIPFDINDVYIDVQIVNQNSAQQGQMDVVLVAAKKDFVNEYTSVVMEAGLEPVVCDVDAFAVETMFEANYEVPQDQTIALVNIGASKTNINIITHGISSFTRDLNVGGNNFTEEIQKQMNVSQEEAEAMKVSISGDPASGGSELTVPGSVSPEVEQALQGIADNITSDVQRSIDFYSATSADPSPSNIYLSGGSARLPALARSIQTRIGVPVHVVETFRRIQPGTVNPEVLQTVGPAAAVAVGLALRYPGDG